MVQCRHEACLGSERRIPCSQGMWGHIWCSLHKNQQQIFNVRIQGDTRFPFTQKEHMVDTGTGSPQASSTYSMEAYFSASTSIKVAGIKGWHSTSVLTRFGHQKCKLSLLLQWRKCNREATRRPISYDVKSLILQTHVSELTLCDLEQGHLRLIGWLFEESSAQTDDSEELAGQHLKFFP